MPVKKVSVALDPDVAAAASAAAERQGQSLSAWLNEAARNRLRIGRGVAAVAEWEQVHGPLTDSERATADHTLDSLLGHAPADA